MDKVFMVKRVGEKLIATEAAIDAAYAEATELMSDILKGRQELKFAASVVDDTQAKLLEAIKAISEARTAMVAVHEELAEVKLRIGVRTKMYFMNKPSLRSDDETRMRDVG